MARRSVRKTRAAEVPHGRRFNWPATMAVALLAIYLGFGNVWKLSDAWVGLRGIVLLWLPVALLLFVLLRDECVDACETVVLSAVGSLALTTALTFSCDVLATWWQ